MRGVDRWGDRGNGVVQRGYEESVERPWPLPDDYALTDPPPHRAQRRSRVWSEGTLLALHSSGQSKQSNQMIDLLHLASPFRETL